MTSEAALTIESATPPPRVLDVQGLNCPMPLLRAKLVLGELASGEHLLVLATDPYSVMDFEAFCTKTGHQLLVHDLVDGVFRFLLRRK
ncbi:MAG: tRNA 2-thiouridine synthesizing protein A [Gammaproteobacteria bacterium]|jgi:tRNA 2-thiouridine synthesizing protein A